MIALGLLILFGLYIALLVAAWRIPRSRWGRFIAIAVVLSPVIWKTWDMPVGYYRFRQVCNAEAGVKVFESNAAPANSRRNAGLVCPACSCASATAIVAVGRAVSTA